MSASSPTFSARPVFVFVRPWVPDRGLGARATEPRNPSGVWPTSYSSRWAGEAEETGGRRASETQSLGDPIPGLCQQVGSRSSWAPPDLGYSGHHQLCFHSCPRGPSASPGARPETPAPATALTIALQDQRHPTWQPARAFPWQRPRGCEGSLCLTSDSPRTMHLCPQHTSLQKGTLMKAEPPTVSPRLQPPVARCHPAPSPFSRSLPEPRGVPCDPRPSKGAQKGK